ncbi:M48 family metallopeptidase [Portibacter marinus]|uniref:M48 family metallopeptidase n=1 Tax=Portibacter marinus TaxID=2898660 RepID=UPI001F3D79AA|nr:M48 family metallopeptidase [Portibacter marinus]
MPSKSKHKTYLLRVDDLDIPVKIFKERRNSIRASLGKHHAILRLPLFLNRKEEQDQIDRFYVWLKEKVLVEDRFKRRFIKKQYKTGYKFQLYDKEYGLRIDYSRNKNHSAKYLGAGIIWIKLAIGVDLEEAEKDISTLISRVIAKLYIGKITDRVQRINDAYFGQNIKSVKLKYNRSNWGSCSTSSNINLSTRLLFAPESVQDYVIVHELAHLLEMNHSKRFWKIVSEVMPDYKKAEKWLKTNGHECDF